MSVFILTKNKRFLNFNSIFIELSPLSPHSMSCLDFVIWSSDSMASINSAYKFLTNCPFDCFASDNDKLLLDSILTACLEKRDKDSHYV